MGCHSAIYYGNAMVYTGKLEPDGTTPLMNVSPFGEWRWSPMGLAGRDPIFYSQLDRELAYLKTIKDKAKGEKLAREVVNTCFRCHGVMGKRQFDLDQGGPADFDREIVYLTDMNDPNFKYGALARDGVSCAACHHTVEDKKPPGVAPLTYFLANSITGQFQTGKADEIYGPRYLTFRATIYHQTIPPYYLKMRFDEAPDYPATRRLYYLTSNLKTSGTPIENWKLKIVSSSAPASGK